MFVLYFQLGFVCAISCHGPVCGSKGNISISKSHPPPQEVIWNRLFKTSISCPHVVSILIKVWSMHTHSNTKTTSCHHIKRHKVKTHSLDSITLLSVHVQCGMYTTLTVQWNSIITGVLLFTCNCFNVHESVCSVYHVFIPFPSTNQKLIACVFLWSSSQLPFLIICMFPCVHMYILMYVVFMMILSLDGNSYVPPVIPSVPPWRTTPCQSRRDTPEKQGDAIQLQLSLHLHVLNICKIHVSNSGIKIHA